MHSVTHTVSDLLRGKGRDIWSVAPDATVYDAIYRMAEKGIGAVLVMDGSRLVGILSERDYARKVILQGKSSRETRVREIMSHPVVCVRPDLTIREAMAVMTEKRIRHLPVVVKGAVHGVISIGDVVRGVIEDNQTEIRELRDYIHLRE